MLDGSRPNADAIRICANSLDDATGGTHLIEAAAGVVLIRRLNVELNAQEEAIGVAKEFVLANKSILSEYARCNRKVLIRNLVEQRKIPQQVD